MCNSDLQLFEIYHFALEILQISVWIIVEHLRILPWTSLGEFIYYSNLGPLEFLHIMMLRRSKLHQNERDMMKCKFCWNQIALIPLIGRMQKRRHLRLMNIQSHISINMQRREHGRFM